MKSLATVDVYFSPNGGCTKAITDLINKSKMSILVQSYSFTSLPIAKALGKAVERGVYVIILIDSKQCGNASEVMLRSGVEILYDAKHSIAHNKIIIIDRQVLITGSFNFTYAAENKNAENVLVIRGHDVVEQYYQNWKRHQVHSTKEIKKVKNAGTSRRSPNKVKDGRSNLRNVQSKGRCGTRS